MESRQGTVPKFEVWQVARISLLKNSRLRTYIRCEYEAQYILKLVFEEEVSRVLEWAYLEQDRDHRQSLMDFRVPQYEGTILYGSVLFNNTLNCQLCAA